MRRLSSRGALKIYRQPTTDTIVPLNQENVSKGLNPDMQSKLEQLFFYKDEIADHLPPHVHSIYNGVVSYAKLVYGTADYDTFYSQMRSVFGRSPSFSPGTIGAYFAGCAVSNNLDLETQKCSVLCVNALPPPNGHNSCSHSVYLVTEVDSTSHDIKKLSTTSDDANAIVYIKSVTKNARLTVEDVAKLKEYGVNNVSIYISSTDYTTYAPVTNGFVGIDTVHQPSPVTVEPNLQETDTPVPTATTATTTSKVACKPTASVMSSGIVIAIVVIIIIIVLLIIVIAAEFYYPRYFPRI